MRRFLILALVPLLMLTGCVYKPNYRPTNQAPSLWVCEEPRIEVFVSDEYKENGFELLDPTCKIYDGNQVIDCDILFDYGAGVTITINKTQISEKKILEGLCDYTADTFTVTVQTDEIFDNKYEELVFVKQDNMD